MTQISFYFLSSVAGKVILTLAFGSFFFTYIFSLDMRTAFWFGVQLCLVYYNEIMHSLIYLYVRVVALLTDQPFVIRPAQFERGQYSRASVSLQLGHD